MKIKLNFVLTVFLYLNNAASKTILKDKQIGPLERNLIDYKEKLDNMAFGKLIRQN